MGPLNSAFEFLNKGGFTMYILVFCSIAACSVIAERLYSLRKLSIDAEWLTQQLALFLQDKKIAESIQYLRQLNGALPKVLEAGLMRFDKDKEIIEASMLNTIQEQTPVLEKFISTLGTISVIAPFLGLLGTITGMIGSFTDIALKGTTGPAVIATGVYEALYTTAAGLIIAIPSVIFYNYFRARIGKMITDMEVASNKTIEMIMLSRKGEQFPDDLLPDSYNL